MKSLIICLFLLLSNNILGQNFVGLKPLVGSEVVKSAGLYDINPNSPVITSIPQVIDNDTTDTFTFSTSTDNKKLKVITNTIFPKGTIVGFVFELDSLQHFTRPSDSFFYQLCTEWNNTPSECITLAPSMIKPLGGNKYQVSFQTIYNFNSVSFLSVSNPAPLIRPTLRINYFFVAKGLSNCDVQITKLTVQASLCSLSGVSRDGSLIIQTNNADKSNRYQNGYGFFVNYFTFETPSSFNQPLINDTVTVYGTHMNSMRFRFEGSNSCYKDTIIRSYVQPCSECVTPRIHKLTSACTSDYQLNISYQGTISAYILTEEDFPGNWAFVNELPQLTLKKGVRYRLELFYGLCPMYSNYQIFEPITEKCPPITVVKIKP